MTLADPNYHRLIALQRQFEAEKQMSAQATPMEEAERQPEQAQAPPLFLTIALPLVQRGFKVTPLRGKAPFMDGWKELASSDPVVLEQWARKWPDYNVGIVETPDNWFVDVDHMNWFWETKAAWPMPKTFVVKTGSGKLHLHFKGPRPAGLKMVKNPAHVSKTATPHEPVKLLEYPDMVVAPESIHPETGKPYTIYQDEPLIECPAEWLQWLQSLNDKKQLSKTLAKLIIKEEWNPEVELEKAGLKFTKRVEGDNIFLNYHASMKKCLVKGGPHHSNGHEDGQTQSRFLVHKLSNGWDLAHQCFSCGCNTKEALAALGITLKDIIAADGAYRVEIFSRKASTIKSETWEWIVYGYIPKGAEVHFFAGKGRGKTKICNYWNKLANDQGMRVIRFNMEDHEASILIPNLHASGCNMDLTEVIDRTALAFKDGKQMPTSVDFSQQAHIDALERYITGFRDVGLVIIEPINNYKGRAKAISEDDMRPIHTALATLAEKLRVGIAVISHKNRKKDVDIQEKAHGASSGINVARVNLYLENDPHGDDNVRILTDAGSNIWVGPSLAFRIVEQLPFDLDGVTHKKIAIAVCEGETDISSQELSEATESPSQMTQAKHIAGWLVEFLTDKGEVRKDVVVGAGKQFNRDWSEDNIKQVLSRRFIKKGKGYTRYEGGGKNRITFWSLGKEQTSFLGLADQGYSQEVTA